MVLADSANTVGKRNTKRSAHSSADRKQSTRQETDHPEGDQSNIKIIKTRVA